MMQTSEIETDHLVRALRMLVEDLTVKHSPFVKDEGYLRNVAGWIACAATRIEQLQAKGSDNA